MRKIPALVFMLSVCSAGPAAAVNSWASNTAIDQAEVQQACARDAHRFCGGNTLFIFEMENCLKDYLPKLTKACRQMMSPTDFRKYYRREADWLPF